MNLLTFGLGMLTGSLLAVVWVRFERRHLIEEIDFLRERLTDEMQWQQILGSSLYDPEED